MQELLITLRQVLGDKAYASSTQSWRSHLGAFQTSNVRHLEELVECIVALPKQLFYNTGIPACLWFLRREKANHSNEVLFINASEMGFMKDRVHRDLADEDIDTITDTYHNWRKGNGYEDIKGYCKSATIEEIQKHKHVLTPGRYVGIPDEEDDGIPFEEKMADLSATLKEQMEKEEKLNQEIKDQLSNIGIKL